MSELSEAIKNKLSNKDDVEEIGTLDTSEMNPETIKDINRVTSGNYAEDLFSMSKKTITWSLGGAIAGLLIAMYYKKNKIVFTIGGGVILGVASNVFFKKQYKNK